MDKPIKPLIPYTDLSWRIPVQQAPQVTPHTDEHCREPDFKCTEVPVYTQDQLLAYGRKMHLHGIAESQYIAEQYCDSMMLRFANAKDVARALHNHFHFMRTNYDNTRG